MDCHTLDANATTTGQQMKESQFLELRALGMSSEDIWDSWSEWIKIAEKSCLKTFDVIDRLFLELKHRLIMGDL